MSLGSKLPISVSKNNTRISNASKNGTIPQGVKLSSQDGGAVVRFMARSPSQRDSKPSLDIGSNKLFGQLLGLHGTLPIPSL